MAETDGGEVMSVEALQSQDVTSWNLPDGAIARLGRGSEPKMAFSPDGQILVIGTCIGLWIYDLVSLSPIAFWEVDQGYVESVTLSPNGKWIAASFSGSLVKILDVQNGSCLTQVKLENLVDSITFSHDNRYFAVTYSANSSPPVVEVWHVETGKQYAKFTTDHERGGFYRPICFSPDTQLIASTSLTANSDEAGLILVWDMKSGEQIGSLSTHTRWVTTLCFSPCGQFLASGGEDGTVFVWDVETWKQVECHTAFGSVYRIIPSWTPDGSLRAAIVHYDDNEPMTISVLDLESGKEHYTDKVWGNTLDFSHIGQWGNNILFSNGSHLAYESRHEFINVWSTDNPAKRQFTHSPISWPKKILFSQDGKTLAVEHHHEGVMLWDFESRSSRPAIKEQSSGKNQFVYKTDDGQLYASCIKDDTVTLWEADGNGTPIIEGTGREYWSASPALAPTGKLFAYADTDGNIHIWDVSNGEMVHKLEHALEPSDDKVDDEEDDGDFVLELEFSLDSKLLVSESKSRYVRLWDMELGQEIDMSPIDRIMGFRFCDCGQHLVCFGEDEDSYWNITRREFCEDDTCQYESKKYAIEKRLSLPQECKYIENPAFTAYEQYIAFITSWDEKTKSHPICLFEAESEKHLVSFTGHILDVNELTFSPDNRILFSASDDGTILLWDLTPYL